MNTKILKMLTNMQYVRVGSLVAEMVKNQWGRPRFNPWVWKIPWTRAWQPIPELSPGEFPWTEEWGVLGGTGGKEPACQCSRPQRRGFDPWDGKIP